MRFFSIIATAGMPLVYAMAPLDRPAATGVATSSPTVTRSVEVSPTPTTLSTITRAPATSVLEAMMTKDEDLQLVKRKFKPPPGERWQDMHCHWYGKCRAKYIGDCKGIRTELLPTTIVSSIGEIYDMMEIMSGTYYKRVVAEPTPKMEAVAATTAV
ncbi:hypothetical protein LTR85_010158 [Meristemomyces frigidus]|nr:hypothetical protein LTR85_010158 [Meristemomyces frigidus]